MIDERFEMGGDSSPPQGALDDQRRLLELELVKVRSEALAARLEARAAEIELTIRRLDGGQLPKTSVALESAGAPGIADQTNTTGSGASVNPPQLPVSVSVSKIPASPFRSWDEVRSALHIDAPSAESAAAELQTADVNKPPGNLLTRLDAAEPTPKRPHLLEIVGDESADTSGVETDSVERRADDENVVAAPTQPRQTSPPLPQIVTDDSVCPTPTVSGRVSIEADPLDDEDSDSRRRRPAAWLVSAIAHAAALMVLAMISLQTQRPKDQVALSASAKEANEVSMETFTIESSELQPETAEPTPSETEYDLSPVGEIAATDFAPQTPPAPPSPSVSALSSSQLSSAAAMAVTSDSDAKIQFCGVEGGGNHFVYLVDSSGSMGDGFESARAELLASIEVLKPDQRFYVVFFDAASDYMRLGNADQDEPGSVYATSQNKAAVKRWAMRIAMDKGRAPYDPLRFALKLRPDVIFLLSDGEFPQGIEDLLRTENRVENLFGDSHPISIVHTIGYHSREGETRMRRIAEQNQGQYRYIPKP